MGVPEAPLGETEHGLVCTGAGWFVVNAQEVRWRSTRGAKFTNFGGDTVFDRLESASPSLVPASRWPPTTGRPTKRTDGGEYVADPVAAKHGASPERTTTSAEEAHAGWERPEFARYDNWLE